MRMLFSRKSEADQPFHFLIAIVVVVIIIIFGYAAIAKIMSNMQDTEMADFANTLKEDIKMAAATKGSKIQTYNIPSKVKSIVFIDPSNQKALLSNPFIQDNPIIEDAVRSGAPVNMFLFTSSGKLIKGFYIGDIATGYIGDQMCTGVGKANASYGELKIRISNFPGVGVMLGEECEGLNYETFQGPYDSSVLPISDDGNVRVKISQSKRQITLNENTITGPGMDYTAYFPNGSINSTVFNVPGIVDGQQSIDRFFYSANVPLDTNILFRIGFKNRNLLDWRLYGPNLSAVKPTDPGYYYEYPGQYITPPSYPYEEVIVQATLFSNMNMSMTPTLNWLKISYYQG